MRPTERIWISSAAILGLSAGCRSMDPGEIARIDAGFLTSVAIQRGDCQIAGATSGTSKVSPPFEARCGSAPDKKCRIAALPQEPWEYVSLADDPVWKAWIDIGYEYDLRSESWFHRQLAWELVGQTCRITGTLFGDFDDDGDYSTYEMTYTFTPRSADARPEQDQAGRPVLFDFDRTFREDEAE